MPPQCVLPPVSKGMIPVYTSQILYERTASGNDASTPERAPAPSSPARSRLATSLRPLTRTATAPAPLPTVLNFISSWKEEHEVEELSLRTDGETAGGGFRTRYIRITFDVSSKSPHTPFFTHA